MNFLFPNFLFGLLAVGIPVIIHLFNFQRPKTVLFTNVRFLKNVKEITTSRLKLKHLLVLICRILFLIFLVLTFAQPFIPGKSQAETHSKSNVLAYLDNSFSMQSGNEGENLLDLAIKDFRKLLGIYPLNTQFQITTNDFEGKDQFLLNKDKINERLGSIVFSHNFRDLQTISNRISSSVATSTKNHQVFIFSDFQKSTLGNLSALRLDTNQQYFFVPLVAEEKSNVFIDSVWLESPMVRANETNTLNAILQNSGGTEAKKILVKLYIDNVQSNATEVEIAPNGQAKIAIGFACSSEGQKQCKLVFEDYPVVFDNSYYFTLEVSPKIKILNLYQSEQGFVKKVYSNPQLFDLHSQSVNEFDYSLVEASSLVILENINSFSPSLIAGLDAFVSKGGSLAIYPSADMDRESYSTLFNKLAIPIPTALATDTGMSAKINYTLQAPNYQHPFFKNVFEKEDKIIDMPYAYTTISLQKQGEKILQQNNGDFYLSQFKRLNGKIFLFSSPLEVRFTNFPKHTIFVPVMYKLAFESTQNTSRLAYSLQEMGATFTLPSDFAVGRGMFSLQRDSLEVIPPQQLQGRTLTFSLSGIGLQPGTYQLKYENRVISKMALNKGSQESRGETYTIKELEEIAKTYPNVNVYKSTGGESFLDQFKKDNIGIALWKYCLLASILFLGIEIMLLRFYK